MIMITMVNIPINMKKAWQAQVERKKLITTKNIFKKRKKKMLSNLNWH